MRGSPLKKFVIVVLVFIGLAAVVKLASGWMGESEKVVVSKNTILHLDLEGVIMNGKKFLKNLKKYQDNDKVKAILVDINSPGGAVGPSQELNAAIKRVRDEFKKPVVCVSTGIMASGAYYTAVACDKIIVSPGALVGSIGVVMEFANLEKLYDWAKVSRYSITSGKFKDSGAEYRPMRDDEKALFQDMINEVYVQFKETVMKDRGIKEDVMQAYADGRVFTGAQAVKLGFADEVGTYEGAVKKAAELANLGDDYEVYEIPKKRMSIFDLGGSDDRDSLNTLAQYADFVKSSQADPLDAITKKILKTQFLNQPMYLLPGYWQ